MEKDDTGKKVICYVGGDGIAVLHCQQCERTKTIDAKNKNHAFRSFREMCKCGSYFIGQLEFRRYYRKKVRLPGRYRQQKTGARGDILVENISLMGVGFSCLRKHKFQTGDLLDITFTLDNPNQSRITLKVEVRTANDRFIGVERCDAQLLQPELGFYLR